MAKLKSLKPRLGTVGSRLPAMAPNSWRNDKQSSTQRGYGYKWQQARAGYLAKHPFCVFCLRDAGILATSTEGIILECTEKRVALPYATVVDHKIAHRGRKDLFWDRSNWAALCASHHSSEAQVRDNRQQY